MRFPPPLGRNDFRAWKGPLPIDDWNGDSRWVGFPPCNPHGFLSWFFPRLNVDVGDEEEIGARSSFESDFCTRDSSVPAISPHVLEIGLDLPLLVNSMGIDFHSGPSLPPCGKVSWSLCSFPLCPRFPWPQFLLPPSLLTPTNNGIGVEDEHSWPNW